MESIESNFIKNAYPPSLIDKVIKKYLDHKFCSNQNQLKDTSDVYYSHLVYIAPRRYGSRFSADYRQKFFSSKHDTEGRFLLVTLLGNSRKTTA